MIGEVFHRVIEGRDRTNVFLRVVGCDTHGWTATRLATRARPDDPPEPWGDTGVEWPTDPLPDPTIRLVPADDGALRDATTGDVYELWDGEPKAYRYT